MYPFVTVTCTRDLALLELQAQSMSLYAPTGTKVYLVVNEQDPTEWKEYFNEKIRHYYKDLFLTVHYLNEFEVEHKWAGWYDQQHLKFAISEKIAESSYLILDSQNFLIRKWNYTHFPVKDGKVPYRNGMFVMPSETWHNYAAALGTTVQPPDNDTMSICTPIWFNTDLVKSLIAKQGGFKEFSKWFNRSSRVNSEFMLYAIWAECNGGIKNYHYRCYDWGNPYPRDSDNFDSDFQDYLNKLGVSATHVFTSINHKSWGNLSDEQYAKLCARLAKYKLTPNFDSYRLAYS
jgi:hypothetical protein